jgi:hypothetical protein
MLKFKASIARYLCKLENTSVRHGGWWPSSCLERQSEKEVVTKCGITQCFRKADISHSLTTTKKKWVLGSPCISFKHDICNDALGSILHLILGLLGNCELVWMWKEATMTWRVPGHGLSLNSQSPGRDLNCNTSSSPPVSYLIPF